MHDSTPADIVAVVDHLSPSRVNAQAIKEWTSKYPVLSSVHRFLLSGWPTQKLGSEFHPFVTRKN